MKAFNNFDKIDREYSQAIADVMIRFWRSRSQQAIDVAKESVSTLGRQN